MTRHVPSPLELVAFDWPRMSEPRCVDLLAKRMLIGGTGPTYLPLRDEPLLFLKFAALEDTEDALAEFASRYGDLGGPGILSGIGGLDAEAGTRRELGRPVAEWRDARDFLALAIRLWESLKPNRAEDVLKDVLGLLETEPLGDGLLVSLRLPNGEYGWVGGAPRNARPERLIQTALAALVSSRKRARVSLAVAPGTPGAGLRLTYHVSSLLEAMWLQLVLAIDGDRRYETCPECGNQWDATDVRSDKKTCSDRCRKARSLRIQRRACELTDSGMTPARVAKLLTEEEDEEITEHQVGKWLAAREKRQARARGSVSAEGYAADDQEEEHHG